MRLFGSIKELFKVIWRDENSNEQVELRPSTQVNYTETTVIELPPETNASQTLVSENAAQSLNNKIIDATAATGTNTLDADASSIHYDPTASGLTATDVQDAVDEVEGRLDAVESDVGTLQLDVGDVASDLADHETESTGAHAASAISYSTTTSGIAATDVQAAIDEVEGRVDGVEFDVSTLKSDLGDVENDVLSLQQDVGLLQSDVLSLQTGKQDADSDLTAIAALSSSGLIARTGSGTAATRTVTGTSNQIGVNNGDGVSGNPTLSIADNVVLPGTSAVTLPKGTTAQRTSTPGNGMLRYNDDFDSFEGYAAGQWGPIGGGSGDSHNLIPTPTADRGIGEWKSSAPTQTSITANTTSPLGEVSDFMITKPASNRSGDYIYCPFKVNAQLDGARVAVLEFGFMGRINYIDDAFEVLIRDVDAGVDIIPYSPIDAYKLKGAVTRLRLAWIPSNSSSTNYEVRIRVSTTSTSTMVASFTDVSINYGSPMSNFDGNWPIYPGSVESMTSGPDGYSYDAANSWFRPRRVGNQWFVDGEFRFTFNNLGAGSGIHQVSGALSTLDWVASQPLSFFAGTASNVDSTSGAYTQASRNFSVKLTKNASGSVTLLVVKLENILLNSKPTWADFDPIATYYPTSDDLYGSILTKQNLGLTGAADSTQTAVPNSQILVNPGEYLIEFGGEFINLLSNNTIPSSSSIIYFRVVGGSNLWAAESSLSSSATNTASGSASNIFRHTFTEPTSIELALRAAAAGSTTDRGLRRGYIVMTRLSPSALPPIGLQLAGANNPGLLKAYEEGTWTPTISLVNNVTGTPIVVGQATYTRVGRTVFVKVPRISGFDVTATNTRTTLSLIGLAASGLPGIKNGTQLYGTAWTRSSNSTSMPLTASLINGGSVDIAGIYFESKSTGDYLLWGIWFMYDIED